MHSKSKYSKVLASTLPALVCLLLLVPISCISQVKSKMDFPDNVMNKPFGAQCLFLDSLNRLFSSEKADSAILVLSGMEQHAKEADELNFSQLLSLYRLSWLDAGDPIKEEKLLELTRALKGNNEPGLEAEALQKLADFYWLKKKYSASLENYLFAYELYSPIPAAEFPHKAEYMYDLGLRYYHFRDFETAKKYFLETWQTIPPDLIHNHPSKLNTLGLCYGNMDQLDSSTYYYIKATEEATQAHDEVWEGIISGNLAGNYLKEKKFDKARALIERNIELSTRNHQMMDLVYSLSSYGQLMLQENQVKKALEYQQKALAIIWERGFIANGMTSRVYPKVAKAYAANGNMKMAYAYLDSAFTARDSFMAERNAVFVSGVQHKIDVEKHTGELRKSEEEAKRQRVFQYVLMGGVLLMFGLALLFFLLLRKLSSTHSRLIQSEKLAALGQLSASIAHEVNTPLGGIKSSAEESLNAFADIQAGFLWIKESLNEEERNRFFDFIARSKPVPVSLSTKEEREIKKQMRDTFASLGIENARFLAERMVQVGIYEVSPELEKLAGNPQFEKMLLLAFNLFNQQHSNRTIVTAVDKASRIVKAMKKYIHSANSDKMEAVNLRDNIETVLTIYQNRLKLGIQVIKNYQSDVEVFGFPDQLNQVWTNLIVNAVQAMDNNGILTISIVEEGENVLVKIRDTGKGIPKAIQSKVFSPFFTTKKPGEGSGLGLHIIRKIVQEHSGTITFESIEGEGTVFIVKFPVQQEK